MSSLLTGLIDCVARPSTCDTPVRVIRKTSTTDAADASKRCCSSRSVDGLSVTIIEGDCASDSMDRSVGISGEFTTTVFPISPAESAILKDGGGITIGEEMYNDDDDDGSEDTISLNSAAEATIRQQFEAAFATFLYKNPAFTSMSHSNLARVRSKLAKESAKHARAEAELRRQLDELRESKRKVENELQRELLAAARAKATREADLRDRINKTRMATIKLDESLQYDLKAATDIHKSMLANFDQRRQQQQYHPRPIIQRREDLRYSPPSVTFQGGDDAPRGYLDQERCGNEHYSPQSVASINAASTLSSNKQHPWPSLNSADSFQEDLITTRMEHAMLRAEMEQLRQNLVEQDYNFRSEHNSTLAGDDSPVSHYSYLERGF